ncbi:helix-turn-helix domain-containing protein [Streptomyces mayteni]
MASSGEGVRLAVAALMYATGETQADVARGIGLDQTAISRRQAGTTTWSLTDLDRLAAHYGMHAVDLLCGVDHAVAKLPAHRRAAVLGGTQTVIPPQEGENQ